MTAATPRHLLLALGVGLFGAALLGASTARAVPFDNRPKILLHVQPVTSKNACASGGNLTDCAAAVTNARVGLAETGPFYYMYVLVATGPNRSSALGGNNLGIAGAKFGLHYDDALGQGVDVITWNLCGTLEFTSTGYPASGGGNLLTWDATSKCQRGEVAVAGYFYCAAYSADTFALTPRPSDQQTVVADCNSNETPLTPQDLGRVVFTDAGTMDGCNPCAGPCPSAATSLACDPQASPDAGNAPLTVSFTGSGGGGTPPYHYTWDFGDGATSSSSYPTHQYAVAGTYEPRVTATDSGEPAQTWSGSTRTITVSLAPLACSPTATPSSGAVPLEVHFQGVVTGGTPPISYFWDFGDGASSTLQNPTHTYATSGTLTATFSTFDAATPAASCSQTFVTTVSDPNATEYAILRPNGGETWLAGSPVTIQWKGPASGDLAISYDAGGTWTTLLSGVGTAGSNTTPLLAPFTPTPAARVRVTRTGELPTPGNFDASDAVFRIVTADAPPPAAARQVALLHGETAGERLGQAVAGLGDFNGDGYADYAVAAPFAATPGTEAGRVSVHFGGPAGSTPAPLALSGAAGERFGWSLAGVGDVDGDGFNDLLVGAPGADAGAGLAYLFLGSASPDATPDLVLAHSGAGDNFGLAVGGAGDFNGDGFADLLVGAPYRDAGGVDAGSAYLYLGSRTPEATAELVLDGAEPRAGFGMAVAGAGDLNGDGFADAAVGAPLSGVGAVKAGRAFVYLGGAAPDGVADLALGGLEAQGALGQALAPAGDMNGDGYDDLAVGAPGGITGTSAGHALVYYGGHLPDDAADLVLAGARPGDGFGTSLAAADCNADDFSDLFVGAPFNDAGAVEAGRAWLYFGGIVPNDTPDFTWTGTAAGDQFGGAVAGVGDLDGDGFEDLLIGASLNDAGGAEAGAAALYDLNRYQLLAPLAGVTWNVGATQSIRWLGAAPADVLLSMNGGRSWDLLAARVGGNDTNVMPLRVPHAPSVFARVKVQPVDPELSGWDVSDSLFTIQSTVSLLEFQAEPVEGATLLSWSTEPAVSPDGIAGYRLYRTAWGGGGAEARLGGDLLLEGRYRDATGHAGDRYRLAAVNGLGEELELGSLASAAPFVGLRISPSPARVGSAIQLTLSAPGLSAEMLGDLDVGIYDLRGRRVGTVLPDRAGAGGSPLVMTWNGRDGAGRPVVSGVYFIRAHSAHPQARIDAQQRITLVR